MQEVLQQNKEIEFIKVERKVYECSNCHKKYKHIERCKDGKDRCKRCKRFMVTNKFYNPDWKNNKFIGKYNMSSQEIGIQISNLIRQGLTPTQARSRVFFDINTMKKNRITQFCKEKQEKENIEVNKQRNSEMNKRLIEGLK
jgi:ribosomal protein L37AE/L43A